MQVTSPVREPLITGGKTVKDVSAGAVLVCSIAAFITGGIIFIPKILLYV